MKPSRVLLALTSVAAVTMVALGVSTDPSSTGPGDTGWSAPADTGWSGPTPVTAAAALVSPADTGWSGPTPAPAA